MPSEKSSSAVAATSMLKLKSKSGFGEFAGSRVEYGLSGWMRSWENESLGLELLDRGSSVVIIGSVSGLEI